MGLARTNADAVHHIPGQATPAARERERLIRQALADGPLTPAEIERRTGLAQPVVAAMLSLLADRGVLLREDRYRLPRPGGG